MTRWLLLYYDLVTILTAHSCASSVMLVVGLGLGPVDKALAHESWNGYGPFCGSSFLAVSIILSISNIIWNIHLVCSLLSITRSILTDVECIAFKLFFSYFSWFQWNGIMGHFTEFSLSKYLELTGLHA